MKVVVLDGMLINYGNIKLDFGPEHELAVYPATRPEQLAQRAGDADAVITNRLNLNREQLKSCPKVKYIGVTSTGYNMIDLEAASERGIVVCNCPAYGTLAVAQFTMGLLLGIACQIPYFDNMVRQGQWAPGSGPKITAARTFELEGKTMGIFGCGDIGGQVARYALGMGMKVLAYRRTPPAEGMAGVDFVDIHTLLARSDVLSLHAPLTDDTQGFINRDTIARMKDGAILLNTSRGAVVDEAALAEALDSGKIYAFGADVLAKEPPEPDNPLVGHPRTLITPHASWLAQESRERLLKTAVDNFRAFVAGNPQNVVNP